MNDPIITVSIPFFVIAILVEAIASVARARDVYERRDTAASLTVGISSLLFSAVAHLGLAAILTWTYQFRLWTVPNTWWGWVLGFIAVDFLFYWGHRAHHEVRVLWASHVVHHSSQRYNYSTALRQSWFEPFTLIPFWIPLSFLGFEPNVWFVCFSLNLVYQFLPHTVLVDRLGPLEWVMNTPSHHRVHHGSNIAYLDRNYGGVFIIWDRLFGTFQQEHDEATFGLVHDIDTFNPVRINTHEWASVLGDAWRAGPRHALRTLFGPPGWRPDGASETVADLRVAAGLPPTGPVPPRPVAAPLPVAEAG